MVSAGERPGRARAWLGNGVREAQRRAENSPQTKPQSNASAVSATGPSRWVRTAERSSVSTAGHRTDGPFSAEVRGVNGRR